ncbi:hypothetical protein GCM10027360_88020 [Amycolatopsis echigonensis]
MPETSPLTQCAAVRSRSPVGLCTTLAEQKWLPPENNAPTVGLAVPVVGVLEEFVVPVLRESPPVETAGVPAPLGWLAAPATSAVSTTALAPPVATIAAAAQTTSAVRETLTLTLQDDHADAREAPHTAGCTATSQRLHIGSQQEIWTRCTRDFPPARG